ncbi:MAG: hypothetical protein ABEI86_06975, partial [Halobacteriaceae archaeon]
EIAGVPPAFVVEMGHGRSSKPYVTKEGLTYLANKQDLQVRAEPISPSWEEPTEKSAWRGIVEDEDGNTWADVGTAHLEHEDMKGAVAMLRSRRSRARA